MSGVLFWLILLFVLWIHRHIKKHTGRVGGWGRNFFSQELKTVTRLQYEAVYHTKHLFVIVGGLAPQKFLLFVCKNTPPPLGNKSVDGCRWILFGAGGIFIYKYVLHHKKMEVGNFYEKRVI